MITEAYTKCYEQLTRHGHVVKLFMMDNECSADLKRAILKVNGDFQLVLPRQHRRNAAEKAICTANIIYKRALQHVIRTFQLRNGTDY